MRFETLDRDERGDLLTLLSKWSPDTPSPDELLLNLKKTQEVTYDHTDISQSFAIVDDFIAVFVPMFKKVLPESPPSIIMEVLKKEWD